jgi:hypothetical protein
MEKIMKKVILSLLLLLTLGSLAFAQADKPLLMQRPTVSSTQIVFVYAGDLWIVGTDYAPPGYSVGTMLRAEHTNGTYTDSDWVPATKYDEEIEGLKATVDSYKQYFSVNSTNGLQIGNSSINNDILTTGVVNATTVNADSASFESLDVVGRYSGSTMLQAPVINLGKFSIVIESNGSLSIVANT